MKTSGEELELSNQPRRVARIKNLIDTIHRDSGQLKMHFEQGITNKFNLVQKSRNLQSNLDDIKKLYDNSYLGDLKDNQ